MSLDGERVIDAVIVVIVLCGVVWLSYSMYSSIRDGSLVNKCRTTPSLLYAQACSGRDDCLTKCVETLKHPVLPSAGVMVRNSTSKT
jgi:hypothetical protein